MKRGNVFLIVGVICLVTGMTMDAINIIPNWVSSLFAVMAIPFLVTAFVLEASEKEKRKIKKAKKNPPADEKKENTEGTEI